MGFDNPAFEMEGPVQWTLVMGGVEVDIAEAAFGGVFTPSGDRVDPFVLRGVLDAAQPATVTNPGLEDVCGWAPCAPGPLAPDRRCVRIELGMAGERVDSLEVVEVGPADLLQNPDC